jgi:hypothetical protein
MSTIIYGFFDEDEAVRSAVGDLEAAAIPFGDISVIASDAEGHRDSHCPPASADRVGPAAGGASIGGVIGGGAGLLAGLGIVALPGLAPVIAAGWLASTATCAVAGAAAGGVVGALLGAGMSSEHAEFGAEDINEGGTLVAVRVRDERASTARAILLRNGAIDACERLTSYRSAGWTGFDEDGAPFAGPEARKEGEGVRYSDMLRHH